MEKRISTAVTYELPITEYACVKKFLSEIHKISQTLKKSDYWEQLVTIFIRNGLKVVFVHLWNTEDQYFEGVHYKEEMVFEAFLGFNNLGMELYSMGEFAIESVEALCEKYEQNPDFIFTELDWDSTKEDIINEFLCDLKKYDFLDKEKTQ